MTAALYNEIDPFAADWLEALIREGHVARGTVDRRSIRDLRPEDVAGAAQFHAFAGIAGWSLALRLAGWADDARVWTGSCPCQPFSSAGRRRGTADERHLWPEWFRLIRECRPGIIFGEQVASTHTVGSAGARPRVPTGVPAAPSGAGLDPPCPGASGQKGDRLRSGRTRPGDPTSDRCGLVRGVRTAVFAGRRPDMGQPLFGSDRSVQGLPLFERAGGLPRPEQRNGGLGGEQADRDGTRDPFSAARRIEQLVQTHWGEAERDARLAWFDVVSDDLERAGYTVGACVLPACGVGAPHIRQRLYFVAVAPGEGRRVLLRVAEHEAGNGSRDDGDAGAVADAAGGQRRDGEPGAGEQPQGAVGRHGTPGLVGDARGPGLAGRPGERSDDGAERPAAERAGGATLRLGDADGRERGRDAGAVRRAKAGSGGGREAAGRVADGTRPASAVGGPWSDAVWIPCRDGRARPAQPGAFPLAARLSACVGRVESGVVRLAGRNRVGRLRGYGNALTVEVAATFIRAALMAIEDGEPAPAGTETGR